MEAVADKSQSKPAEIETYMKTYKITTEDRYGRFNDYEIQAESLEVAIAKGKLANCYIFDISEGAGLEEGQ